MPDTSFISRIPPASTQEAYDRMRAWFSQPGAQLSGEYDEDGDLRCHYRAPGGQACAAGSVLPDRLYEPRIENKAFHSVVSGRITTTVGPDIDTSAIRDFFVNVDPKFVDQAQSLHDDAVSTKSCVDDFLVELDRLAEEFYLKVPA